MNQTIQHHQGQPALADISNLLEGGSSEAPLKVDLRRLLWGIWQQRLMILGTTVVAGIVAIILAMSVLQPVWTGRTTLLQKEQQDEFRVGRFGIPFKAQEYAFKTLLDTLMLPGTLESAMAKSGIQMSSQQLARRIDVHMGKESKAFTISVQWQDPQVAATLTNNLANTFIERNQQLRRNEIETSLINYRDRLHSAEASSETLANELLLFQSSNDISDIQTQLIVMLEKRQEVEVKLQELEGELHAVTEEELRLREDIGREPDMIVQSSYYVNPLQKNLAEMEWTLSQARGRYTDDNPKVKDLVMRIDKIKALIEGGTDDASPSETFASNPIKQELAITRYEAKTQELRLNTQVARMTDVLADLSERITTLTQQRKTHQALTLKLEAAQGLQNDLSQRVDSLNVLMLGKVGDFELLERASVPTQSEGTGRTLLVLAITVLGGGMALVVALLRELFSGQIHTLKDLALCTDIELMAEFANTATPLLDLSNPVSEQASMFRRFTNDLQRATSQQQLAFVSVDGDQGATTAAINCALALHLRGESLTLVDADLRVTSEALSLAPAHDAHKVTLYDMLRDNDEKRLAQTSDHRLQLITARADQPRQPQDVLLIGGRAMADARGQLEKLHDWTLYNLPPVGEQEASFEALQQIGAAVLVVRSGATSKARMQSMLARMQRHGIQVVALMLMDVSPALTAEGQVISIEDLLSDVRRLAAWRLPASVQSGPGSA